MGSVHKGPRDYLVLGDYNAQCDVCGFKFKASELRTRWDGNKTCPRCWDPRHPQDFVRGTEDMQPPDWVRIRVPNDFRPVCTPATSSAVPGSAGPGCMVPGWVSPFYF